MLVVRDAETLRVVADPLRLRMLELMREGPRTAKEMAGALRVSQTKLYYHLKLLEGRGLIAVAETRLVSGIVEKRYRASAQRLTIDKSLIGPTAEGNDALDTYLSVVLDEARSEIHRSVDAGLIDTERTGEDALVPRRLVLGRKWFRLTPDQVEAFARRYREFTDAFAEAELGGPGDAADTPTAEGQLYEWLVAFYPVLPPDGLVSTDVGRPDEDPDRREVLE